jgi:hypothetical protein
MNAQRRTLSEGAVVIVDEAGQIGGRQLLDLLQKRLQPNGPTYLGKRL